MVRKRVLMITHSYYPQDPRVRREAEALVDAGFGVDVLCLRKPGERARAVHNGVGVFRLPVRRHRRSGPLVYSIEYLLFFLAATIAVAVLFARRGYRVFQAHTIPDFLVFSTIVPRLLGAPVILDMHEVMPEFFAAKFGLGENHPLISGLRLIEKASASFALAVLTVSDPIRDIIVGRGVRGGKISVVMNGADARLFARVQGRDREGAEESPAARPAPSVREWENDDRAPACSPLPPAGGRGGQGEGGGGDSIASFTGDFRKHPAQPVRFIHHGLLSELYDLRPVIRAQALLRDRGICGCELNIVGDGPMLAAYRGLAQELRLQGAVRFHGEVPIETIPSLLREMNAAIVPLRRAAFTDLAMPTKFLECIAMGVPVLAADRATLRCYFGDDCVLYFTPEDVASIALAVEKFVGSPSLHEELARNASRRYEAISWPAMRRRYVEFVEKVARVNVPL
jgi:glycosyltransferase involved in cell wall biosynthesis